MLGQGLVHVVLQPHNLGTNIDGMLTADQREVIIKLVVVGADLGGSIDGIADGGDAGDA